MIFLWFFFLIFSKNGIRLKGSCSSNKTFNTLLRESQAIKTMFYDEYDAVLCSCAMLWDVLVIDFFIYGTSTWWYYFSYTYNLVMYEYWVMSMSMSYEKMFRLLNHSCTSFKQTLDTCIMNSCFGPFLTPYESNLISHLAF